MKPRRSTPWAWACCLVLLAVTPSPLLAQAPSADANAAETAEEKKERVTAERFLQLLKRRPRLGTALDKVYGYHVARGSLESFSDSLAEEAEASNDGAVWLIHGMVQMQRGLDTEAADSLQKARDLLPDQPLASYYLGKTLVLVGEVDQAADAMREAIQRKPARADLLAIFQDLGRIYQRTGRADEAVEVWDELESQFPNDSQVKEEIARVLAEEGALAAAIERYDELVKTTKDRFRKVEMAIRSAQLKAQLGKQDEALRAFEAQLARVNPDSWLHRDIRRRIEEVFWSSGDIDGLVAYYTDWVENHPEDVDAMMRSARSLAVQGRAPEAEKWFRKAIEKSPSSTEPRLALVESLVTDDKYAKAAEEMAALCELQPDDPDYLVRWGELVFSDGERTEDDRRTEAAGIWKRLLERRGDDPVTVARVADLLRGAKATDEALAQYRKAIELSPNEPQYREYLGEYLHQLGRKDEAVDVWRSLAADDRATRDNLVRLGEVFSTFGYAKEALESLATACGMNPTFGHRARYAELLREAGQHDKALAQLDLAEPLAEDPELREIVLLERIKNYQQSGELTARIDQAEADVAGERAEDPKAWRMLALLREANRNFQTACEAAEKAASLAQGDPAIWETLAQLQERSGRFGDAVTSYRRLAAIDRRFLSNYLTQIASLEMRVGNTDEALKTGEELIASAPGNPEHYRFFADLCFQVGEENRGLDVLRRCVRSNPSDSDALLYLARQLSEAFRTDESIELYWRGFDLANDLDGKVAVIGSLTELYLRTNRFGLLIDRLEATGREQNKAREGLLWTAAAHQSAGDLGRAKDLLEQLAREDSRDTKLLKQLVTLSRAESDYESAVEYQKRLVAVAPSPEAEYLLASLLLDLGEVDQSEALWLKLAQRKNDPTALATAIASLVQKEQYDTAAELVDRALAKEADNWEMLCQAMLIRARLGETELAQLAADRVLAMDVDPAEPSKKVKKRIESNASRRNRNPVRYNPYQNLGRRSQMLQTAQRIKPILSPGGNDPYAYSSRRSAYEPTCFRDAQAIAHAVALIDESEEFNADEFINDYVADALESKSPDDLWTALFYMAWRQPQLTYGGAANGQFDECLEELVNQEDPDAASQALSKLINKRQQQINGGDVAPPMDDEELKRMAHLSELASSINPGPYNYFHLMIAGEYARAGRDDEAEELIDAYIEGMRSGSNSGVMMLQAMGMLLSDRFNEAPSKASIEKASALFSESLEQIKLSTSGQSASGQSMHLMAERLVEHDSVDGALDRLDELLQWQAAQTAGMRPSQRDRVSSNNNRPLSYGRSVRGNYEQVVIAFPSPSSYFGAECIFMLHGLYDACKENPKQLAKVRARLDEWNAASTDDPYLRLARLMANASLAYWSEDFAAVKAAFASASDLRVGGQFIDLALTRLLYESGEAREALAVVERLRPLNQRMLVDKELAILQLVLQLGDLERAKQSAKRLFALRLPSGTEFQLADLMYQLRMQELGDRMMGRIRRRSGGKQDTLVQLMTRYASANRNAEAAEIARQVIRRTEPRGVSRSYRQEHVQHEQAVRVLAQTGQLEPLIEQYEALVDRSPRSKKLVDNLAAFYEAAGRRSDAQQLRVKSAEQAPEDPRNLYAAAQQLHAAGKKSEAIDKYIAAVKKSPDLLNDKFYEMRDAFDDAKAWAKLSDGIVDAGIAKFAQSYQMNNLVRELVQAKENEAFNRLVYAGLNAMPLPELSRMMYSISGGEIEVEDRVAGLLGDKLTSDKANLEGLPSNTYVYSRSSGGQTSGFVNGVAFIVSQDEALQERVLTAMRERLEEKEELLFPRVLIGMTLMYADKTDDARTTLRPLMDKEKKTQTDGQAIWCLASAAVNEAEEPAFACELLESVEKRELLERNSSGFQFTAAALLADAYEKADRPADARRLLVDQLNEIEIDERQNQYNPGYGEHRYIESMAGLAQTFVDLGYPAEALIAFRKAYGDEDLLKRAERWGGNSTWRRDRITKGIKEKTNAETVLPILRAALAPQSAADADEDVEQQATVAAFLTSPEVTKRSLIDVRVTMPLEEFTKKISEEDELRAAITEWLGENPIDANANALSPLVTRLMIANALANEAIAKEAANAIERWATTDQTPVESTGGDEEATDEQADDDEDAEEPATPPALPEELLLAMAAGVMPEDTDQATIDVMLRRATDAAERCGQTALADGMKCRLAKRIAADDPDRARAIFLETLDKILPPPADEAAPTTSDS